MNNVCLVGRLTKEPDLRYTQSGAAVSNFTLAVDRRFKKEGQPDTDFIPIVTWQKTAEFAAKYFTKGMRVYVVGSIQTRSWEDQEGKKHYVTEVISNEVGFADGKKDSSNSGSNDFIGGEVEHSDDDLPF